MNGSTKRKSEDADLDEEGRRLRDLEERDEFAKRLNRKDAEKTKKLVEDRSSVKDRKDAALRRAWQRMRPRGRQRWGIFASDLGNRIYRNENRRS